MKLDDNILCFLSQDPKAMTAAKSDFKKRAYASLGSDVIIQALNYYKEDYEFFDFEKENRMLFSLLSDTPSG